jgi:ribosome-associated toxin RatA of RatAB toxin-antitoxin module
MRKKHVQQAAALLLFGGAMLMLSAGRDPLEETKKIWIWTKPKLYPQPIPGDLDINTLSTLLDSGNLQWYLPRPEEGEWDAVAAMKIHAPPDLVWKVVTDYERYPEYMPDTLLESKTLSRQGNEVKNWHRAVNSILNFEYNYEILDVVTEDPPYHLHSETLEGGLKGRQIDWILAPMDQNQNTLIFLRHYPHIKSMGVTVRAVLAVLPMIEWPVSASAANYILRGYKQKAERLVGYTPPPEPAGLLYQALDIETLRKLDRSSCGLIRETREGKTINGLTYIFIDAPAPVVWEVLTDFENYHRTFKECQLQIEKREGNGVWARLKTSSFSILIFSFGMELHNLYTLEPPDHLSIRTIDGLYQGSASDYQILPLGSGSKTLLFHSVGLNLERDSSLTMRMVKSGAFPATTMMCLTVSRTELSSVKEEAEKRARAKL